MPGELQIDALDSTVPPTTAPVSGSGPRSNITSVVEKRAPERILQQDSMVFQSLYFTSDSRELVAATSDRVIRFSLVEVDDLLPTPR